MDFFTTLVTVLLSVGIWLYIIRKYDKFEPEPIKSMLFFVVIGGLASTAIAGILNSIVFSILDIDIGNRALYSQVSSVSWMVGMGFVGLNEEFWKLCITYLLLKKSKEFNEPIDGLIYSMSTALGFAAIENIDYIMSLGSAAVVPRLTMPVIMHIFCAVIWGYGITMAKYNDESNRVKTILPFFITAAVIHAVYNFVQVVLPYTGLLIIPILIFLIKSGNKKLRSMEAISPFKPDGKCISCGFQNTVESSFCVNCGTKIIKPINAADICLKCGATMKNSDIYCSRCGNKK